MDRKSKGFTLIELLVVIAIIGLLASIVLVALNTSRTKARDARRQSDIRQIMTALALYYDVNGQYPLSGGALSPGANWTNSNDSSWTIFQANLSPYMAKLPTDPSQSSSGWAGDGQYSYAYYSRNHGCEQQWYMLVYKPETSAITSPGITACNGTTFNYTGTITTGSQ